jgi:hypothetical protein
MKHNKVYADISTNNVQRPYTIPRLKYATAKYSKKGTQNSKKKNKGEMRVIYAFNLSIFIIMLILAL